VALVIFLIIVLLSTTFMQLGTHILNQAAAIPTGPPLPSEVSRSLQVLDRTLGALGINPVSPSTRIRVPKNPGIKTGEKTYTLVNEERASGALGSGWDNSGTSGSPDISYLGDFGYGPVIVLTDLPANAAVGLLSAISGQSYGRCTAVSRWNSTPVGTAVLPGAMQVCIIEAGTSGQAALMTVREHAQKITLHVITWRRQDPKK
jgi:hypothetical protein